MKKFLVIIIMFLILSFDNISAKEKIAVKFEKCVDGDTADFKLKNEIIKVRFLAIDTPETKHPTKGVEPYGKEASEYTCDAIKKANKINIEYDTNSDKTDKYGRHLVWIWVDDELLQEKLLEKGYAKIAYLYGDYKYTNELKIIEKKAKSNKLGIWGNETNTIYDNPIIIGFTLIIIILLLIFNKKYRKKIIKKLINKV